MEAMSQVAHHPVYAAFVVGRLEQSHDSELCLNIREGERLSRVRVLRLRIVKSVIVISRTGRNATLNARARRAASRPHPAAAPASETARPSCAT